MDAFVVLEACRMGYRQYQTGGQGRQLGAAGEDWRMRKNFPQGPAGGLAPLRLAAADLESS